MKDAQRYRMNAAECLSAAERCGRDFRDLTLATAASWLSLARHQEATDDLVATWTKSHSLQVDCIKRATLSTRPVPASAVQNARSPLGCGSEAHETASWVGPAKKQNQ
jgi:hypothetical protein